eukprot:TRINITY_DN10242_c0_g1_i2.p1 TRINITY_DN10242_c0_g1~~TRINITY_DN10242_c0_g1_i2.p1  ORF type:complete len:201 (+),score=43.71 TRINITY_DN10242_c0_g1_i2:61-663(+)
MSFQASSVNLSQTVEIVKSSHESIGIRVACLPREGGVVIVHIEDGSAASRCPLRKGDILGRINDEPIPSTSREDAIATISHYLEQESIRLTVLGNTDDPVIEPGQSSTKLSLLVLAKAPLAIIAMVLLFFISIVEGLVRVVVWTVRTSMDNMLRLKSVEHINISFELMMSIWYEWVLDDPTYGLNPAKAIHVSGQTGVML